MAERTRTNNVSPSTEKSRRVGRTVVHVPRRSWWPDRSRYVSFECNTSHTGVTTIGLDSSNPTSLDAHDPRGAGEVEGDVLTCLRLDIQRRAGSGLYRIAEPAVFVTAERAAGVRAPIASAVVPRRHEARLVSQHHCLRAIAKFKL